MTDLPSIKVPPPNPDPEDWVLKLHIYWGDGQTERNATLEDVRAVLAAAGYVVEQKTSGAPAAVVVSSEEGAGTSRPAERREEPGTDESWASAEAVLRKAGLDPDQVLRNASEAVDRARAVSIKAYRAAALGALGERDEEPGTAIFGRQLEQCFVPEFCVPPKMVLEVRFPLGGTPRRAMFSDLHQVEREHWISLLPCTECGGPVNDKICVTCHEIVEAKLKEVCTIARDAIGTLCVYDRDYAQNLSVLLKKIEGPVT